MVKQSMHEVVRERSWNLMTPMGEYCGNPVIIERGEGCWLYDIEGKRYFDGNASMWTNVHGHNNAELNEALIKQMGKLAHTTYVGRSNVAAVELTKVMSNRAPGDLNRVFFTNNGSTAIEGALKMSFQYWKLKGEPKRKRVLTLKGGYHGLSFGSLSVADAPHMGEPFGEWLRWDTVVFEGTEELEAILKTRGEEFAAVIMEPRLQSVVGNGIHLHEEGFLKGISGVCRKYGIHLILDEVFVGMGRLGSMFACEQEVVVPDFLCLGKGLGAGYLPIAATVAREEIYEAFLGTVLIHGHTYGGNALACAVAKRSMEMLETRIDSGDMEARIRYFEKAVLGHFGSHKEVISIRQDGFACAVDVGNEALDRTRIAELGQDQGVLIRAYRGGIFLIPPLCVSESEIDFLCERTVEAINQYTKK